MATPGGDEQPPSARLRQWVHGGLALQKLLVFTQMLWPRSPSSLLALALTAMELLPSALGSTPSSWTGLWASPEPQSSEWDAASPAFAVILSEKALRHFILGPLSQ